MKRLIAANLVVASTLLFAGCGDSPEDNAREAGERIGEQLATIRTATSAESAGEAIDKINADVGQAQAEVPQELDEQLTAIRDQFTQDAKAATDATGLRAAYLAAVAQLESLASDTNSVINEFRRGVRQGLSDS